MPPLRTTTFVAKPVSAVAEAKPVDPFFILGCVFLGMSILSSLAAYGYGVYLNSQITKKDGQVQIIEKSLQQYPLEDMLSVSNKVLLIQKLLRNHTFPSTILSALSSGIEKNVYYNSFNLTYSPGVGHKLVLSAVAPDYASVARQMDALKNKTAYGQLFKSVDMTALGKDSFGNKLFDIQIDVAGSLREDQVNFDTNVNGGVINTNSLNTALPQIIKASTTPSSTSSSTTNTNSSSTSSINL